MKYLLALSVILFSFCSSQNTLQQQNKGGLKELLQSGKDVFIENQVFQEDIDLTSLLSSNLISESIYQVKTTSSITFKNCRFEGKISAFINKTDGSVINTSFLSNLSFINCIFNNDVNFRGSSVYGLCDFTKSSFKKTANFEETTFYQNAYFNTCIFSDEVRFQNAYFIKKANFMNSQFNKVASFQSATFNSELQFGVGKFEDFADFSLAKFNDNTLFNYCEFNKKSTFNSAYFTRNVDFINVKFQTGEFVSTSFLGEPRFFQSSVTDSLHFDKSFFLLGSPDMSFLDKQKITGTVKRK